MLGYSFDCLCSNKKEIHATFVITNFENVDTMFVGILLRDIACDFRIDF